MCASGWRRDAPGSTMMPDSGREYVGVLLMTKGSTNRTLDPATKWYRNEGRGPNGRRLCRWCGVEVPKGRRTFCSDECVHEWRLRSDTRYLRDKTFERDQGVCAVCGLDTVAAQRTLSELRRQAHREVPYDSSIYKSGPERRAAMEARLSELLVEAGMRPEIPPDYRNTLWDADHIVPVVEGGGECDLSNIRTLCWWCHKDVTAELRRRLAAKQDPDQLPLFG